MSNRFSRVGDILPAVLQSVGLDKRLKEQELLALWPKAVGEEIAARTRATRMDKGVLVVEVSHSAWIQELHFMEAEIVGKLKEASPHVRLNRIRFVSGDVKQAEGNE